MDNLWLLTVIFQSNLFYEHTFSDLWYIYQGNGTHCDDVDECATIGGSLGHHCTLEHGTCINLPGGYTCACETGYRMDSTNTTCLPVDKCLTNQHTCHSNATCISTGPGTYSCQCLSQFEGDGTQCQRKMIF